MGRSTAQFYRLRRLLQGHCARSAHRRPFAWRPSRDMGNCLTLLETLDTVGVWFECEIDSGDSAEFVAPTAPPDRPCAAASEGATPASHSMTRSDRCPLDEPRGHGRWRSLSSWRF